ncbi:hypothetical protein F7725_001259 [Dissostichus mawsoni]|uniref:Uncharacterized protein n=1 Tax=Dissostichus mawsoni TaxID=36200 RepID=A0A7J5ZGR0_DISMA|nr:hypothetical protein F7725_001259 [Dissostichus mawsoni]
MSRYNIQDPNVAQWLVQLSSDHFWMSTLELNTEPRYVRWRIAKALKAMLIKNTQRPCRGRDIGPENETPALKGQREEDAHYLFVPPPPLHSLSVAVEADPGPEDDRPHKVNVSHELQGRGDAGDHSSIQIEGQRDRLHRHHHLRTWRQQQQGFIGIMINHYSGHQQVDEHGDGEEGASHGGVSAEEEEEVAEQAEQHHPDHVQLEEQVEGVETPGNRNQRVSPSIQSRRQSRQMSSSCHTCSRPCWAVGSRQPPHSSWKNFCRLNAPISGPSEQKGETPCFRATETRITRTHLSRQQLQLPPGVSTVSCPVQLALFNVARSGCRFSSGGLPLSQHQHHWTLRWRKTKEETLQPISCFGEDALANHRSRCV